MTLTFPVYEFSAFNTAKIGVRPVTSETGYDAKQSRGIMHCLRSFYFVYLLIFIFFLFEVSKC